MNKLLVFIDIDGTIAHPGHRLENSPVNDTRGSIEYENWLSDAQSDEKILKDQPMRGMHDYVHLMRNNAVYLTSRDEHLRSITLQWMDKYNFPTDIPLIMRQYGDNSPYTELKETAIKKYLKSNKKKNYQVLVVDDDPKGKLEEVCKRNKWGFHKSMLGGT